MLQDFRDRISGKVAWAIIGVLVVPFALFGIQSYVGGGVEDVVAEVGETKISGAQLQNKYQERSEQFRQMFGDSFKPEMVNKQDVLQQIIDDSALLQHTQDKHYRVTDTQLFAALEAETAFQEDGKFSPEKYQTTLLAQGLQPAEFESRVRSGLMTGQIRDLIQDTVFVLPNEINRAYKTQNAHRQFTTLTFSPKSYLAKVAPTDAQIQARYAENRPDLMKPARVKLAFVELSLAQLQAAIPAPSTEILASLYASEKDKLATPEQRQAKHILIKNSDKDAKAKIEALRAKLTPQNFAENAKTQSQDTGSATSGGDLGMVSRGQMVKPFEEALFAMQKDGEISAPVQTEYGWHLILLEKIQAKTTPPVTDLGVQTQLTMLYQTREAEKKFKTLAENLEKTAFDNTSSLEASAKAIGQPIQQTDWLTASGSQAKDASTVSVAGEKSVLMQAFAPEITTQKLNSRPIRLGEGASKRVVVIRAANYEAAAKKPLAQVKETLRTQLQNEAAATQASQAAQAALNALNAGGSMQKIAAQYGLAPQLQNSTGDSSANPQNPIALEIMTLVRGLPAPVGQKISFGKTQTASDGAYVVAGLSQVTLPDVKAMTTEQRQAMESQLKSETSQVDYRAYQVALQQGLGLSVNDQKVQSK